MLGAFFALGLCAGVFLGAVFALAAARRYWPV